MSPPVVCVYIMWAGRERSHHLALGVGGVQGVGGLRAGSCSWI